jgi:hypothetical protein
MVEAGTFLQGLRIFHHHQTSCRSARNGRDKFLNPVSSWKIFKIIADYSHSFIASDLMSASYDNFSDPGEMLQLNSTMWNLGTAAADIWSQVI